MKTSKIIFISLLCAVALLILAAFIDIRNNGRKLITKPELDSTIEMLPSFKVIDAYNCSGVSFTRNDSTYLKLRWEKDSSKPVFNYSISNDTLKIFNNNFDPNRINGYEASISFAKDVKDIKANRSDLYVWTAGNYELFLNLVKSDLYLYKDSSDNAVVKFLSVNASDNSNITVFNNVTENLEVNLRWSNLYFNSGTQRVSGLLADTASIYLNKASEISLKCDNTSSVRVEAY